MLVPRKRRNENLQPFDDSLNDLVVKLKGLLIVHYILSLVDTDRCDLRTKKDRP